MCINVMHRAYVVAEVKFQWGGRALFKRPVAEGKKLFRWREVLVPMEHSLLPEGRGANSSCPGWEGSFAVIPFESEILELK